MFHTVIGRVLGTRRPIIPDAKLPECATCAGPCCKDDMILLHPDLGDPVWRYETEPCVDPVAGVNGVMLAHKPNGECVYFGTSDGVGRCTIYDHRPVICRRFDCGRAFAQLGRVDRRAMLKAGLASAETFAMGRQVQARRAKEARETALQDRQDRDGARTAAAPAKAASGPHLGPGAGVGGLG
jgi:Fe-S-cluster containining protein